MAEVSISKWDKGGHAGAGDTCTPHGVKDKTCEEGSTLVAKAQEAASATIDKTKDLSLSVVQKVEDVASTIGHKAEEAVDSFGGGMKSLAGTIRDQAPEGGVFGDAAAGVASTLESSGAYLQEHNLQGMAEEATSLIRRYPLQAILLGVGMGFLLGRALRR